MKIINGFYFISLLGLFSFFNSYCMQNINEQELALLDAAKEGKINKIEKALLQKASVDVKDALSMTPLMYAAMNNHPKAVDYLLKRGADAKKMDRDKQTALHRGIQAPVKSEKEKQKNLAALRRLLTHTPDLIDMKTGTGDTPLNLAIAQGYIEGAKLLIDEYQANVHEKNDWGLTCLMNAVFNNNKEMVALLIKAGAQPSEVGIDPMDQTEKTCLEFANDLLNQGMTDQEILTTLQQAT